MSLPKVSIVIPCFNASAFLDDTVASVQNQSGVDWELVIVDDGSTDTSRELIAAWQRRLGKRLRTHFGPNCGVSAARNRGVDMANSKWIKLLDADDLLQPGILEEEVAFALNATTDVAVLASPWCRFFEYDSGDKSFQQLQRPEFADWPTLTLLRADGFVQLGACLISKPWFIKVNGFASNRTHVEDVEFLLRMADAGGKFVALQATDARFLYRTRPDSVSMTGKEKILEGSILNALAVESRAIESGRMCEDLKDVLLDVYGQGLRYWFVHDQSRFEDLYRHVRALEPRYIPKGPRMLSLLSRALGYHSAERVARAYRSGKGLAQRMKARLN